MTRLIAKARAWLGTFTLGTTAFASARVTVYTANPRNDLTAIARVVVGGCW